MCVRVVVLLSMACTSTRWVFAMYGFVSMLLSEESKLCRLSCCLRTQLYIYGKTVGIDALSCALMACEHNLWTKQQLLYVAEQGV